VTKDMFFMALPSNSKTLLERVSMDKCSSLLGLIVSDEGKKIYNIDTRMEFAHCTYNPDFLSVKDNYIKTLDARLAVRENCAKINTYHSPSK